MVNTELLNNKIDASGLKRVYIARMLGISHQALSNKVNNVSPFRAAEVYVLKDLMRLSDDDADSIFFTDRVE